MNISANIATNTKKTALQYALMFLILFSTFFMLHIGVSYTESGQISFYISEIIGLFIGCFVIIYTIINRKQLNKDKKLYIGIIVLFAAYCIIDYFIRIALNGLELKSILIIESSLFVIGFLFLVLYKLVPINVVLGSLAIFSAFLSFISVVLFYFLKFNIAYDILANHATRTYILGVLFPLSGYNFLKNNGKIWSSCFYLHLGGLLFCGLSTGSRINYIFVPIILLGVLSLLFRKKKHLIKISLLTTAIVFVVSLVSAHYYVYMYSELSRLPITNFVMKVFSIEYKTKAIGEAQNDQLNELIKELQNNNLPEEEQNQIKEKIIVESSDVSTKYSNNVRYFAWKSAWEDIKKNPLFGIGLKQYEYLYPTSTVSISIPPHNFLLEYTLAFGIIGFLLWTVVILYPLAFSIKRKFRSFFNNSAIVMMVFSLVFACAGAFVQPYFISPAVMTIIFILIGCYSLCINNESQLQDRKLIK